MLLKNDVIYKLTDKDIKSVYDRLGWKKDKKNKPAIIKIPEERYTFDRANNRKVRPSRINIPLQDSEDNDNEGRITWNYCERPPRKDPQTNAFVYDRKVFPMTGDFALGQDKIELLWFLLFKSSVRKPNYDENGNLEQGERLPKSPVCFYFQNKGKEATIKLAKRQLRSEVESLILGKNAWPEQKIRTYAVAFGCDIEPEDSFNEVKAILLGRIESTPNGYQEFANLSEAENDAQILFLVNNAKKKKAIGIHDEKNAWYYVEDGNMKSKICNLRSSVSAEMSLVMFIKDNPDVASAIEMACI